MWFDIVFLMEKTWWQFCLSIAEIVFKVWKTPLNLWIMRSNLFPFYIKVSQIRKCVIVWACGHCPDVHWSVFSEDIPPFPPHTARSPNTPSSPTILPPPLPCPPVSWETNATGDNNWKMGQTSRTNLERSIWPICESSDDLKIVNMWTHWLLIKHCIQMIDSKVC